MFTARLLSVPARLALLFALALSLVCITRLPLFPVHLYSFDSANLAFALEEFDPSRSQPQPPGYPLFVAEARFLHLFLQTPERTFAVQACLIGALALGMLYLLGRRMFSPAVGLTAAALLFVNPVFWFSGLTSPLRLHLALISVLVAYSCWRALAGEPKFFYAASVVLGLGSGFRPELLPLLLPLWLWTAWQCEDRWVRFIRGSVLLAASALVWILVLVIILGGGERIISLFSAYLFSQTSATSVFADTNSGSWLRWVGRALVWNGLGALPWIWAISFGWKRRHELENWVGTLAFLAAWFLPPLAFYMSVHIGDPDHTLAITPVLCLLGAFCLVGAEEALRRRFPALKEARGLILGISLAVVIAFSFAKSPLLFSLLCPVTLVALEEALEQRFPELRNARGLSVAMALIISLAIFFSQFPLPQRKPTTSFSGFQSAADAFFYGTFETSYKQVADIAAQTDAALVQIRKLKSTTERPVLLLWSIYAEPTWRKVCFYFPSEKVYALYENRGPGASGTRAQLWSGTNLIASYGTAPPFRIPIPEGARLIWLLNPNSVEDLKKSVALREALPVYYSDLPKDAAAFKWGSFEFVPEKEVNN